MTVAKSPAVGEARPTGIAKHRAMTASVGVGEARSLGIAKRSATVVAKPVGETNVDVDTLRREKWILCGAAMSDDDVCPTTLSDLAVSLGARPSGAGDACPGTAVIEINPPRKRVSAVSSAERFKIWPRLCGAAASDRPPETALTTEHFELTADDSQHECFSGCNAWLRVGLPFSGRSLPVRRRGTCDARDTTQEHKENRAPTRRELQIMGGRVGLLVEWAERIETEGGTLEQRRLEFRDLLGEMAIFVEDLNGAEWKHDHELAAIAWWERSANCAFSVMEHAGSSYICSRCKVLLLLRGGNGDEWLVQPHPPCTKSDPTWGTEVWRWSGEVGGENGRLPTHRVDGALLRRRSVQTTTGCS